MTVSESCAACATISSRPLHSANTEGLAGTCAHTANLKYQIMWVTTRSSMHMPPASVAITGRQFALFLRNQHVHPKNRTVHAVYKK